MNKLLFSLGLLFISTGAFAQEPDAAQLHETARQFMRSGDWANAVLVLNKALTKEPDNIAIQKDLALTYYYQRDFAKAKATIKPLVEREDADVQVYQIAGNIYKALQEAKDSSAIENIITTQISSESSQFLRGDDYIGRRVPLGLSSVIFLIFPVFKIIYLGN